MRTELHPAFVLHQRPYRETSLIVEILGRDTGRVGVVAKGARRPKSPVRGLLQPFRGLLASWSGRGELAVLTGAEFDGYASPLGGSALFSGLYMNELLMRLMHRHDPYPDLFESYRLALDELRRARPVEPVLRVFEKRLLEAIGYGLVLDREVETGAVIGARDEYCYRADRGPVRALAGDAADIRVHGETLLSLARERLEGTETLEEAKRLMRCVLGEYLGERPLATRALFRGRSA